MAKRKSNPKPSSYEPDWYYAPSRPLAANGLQSRSQRGAFASNWWAKRWLAVLESYGMGSRLQRGRSYARRGQVLNIEIQPGQVKARVQGSRPTPYRVTLSVKPLSSEAWDRVLDAIGSQAIFSAQLLDGVMPAEIEMVFQSAKVPLFPSDGRDLTADCSCPDEANPCKHIAAVYYLLGERFDVDPFLIFTLRGKPRDQFIEALRSRRANTSPDSDAADLAPVIKVPDLREQLENFWGSSEFEWSPVPVSFPETPAAIFSRFEPPPYETRKTLTEIYQAMSHSIKTRFLTDF